MIKSFKISIIIPVYNRAELLQYTLNSILEQTFENWECILVDDHSTDSSLEVLKKYEKKDNRFKAYKRPKELTKGANSCRNHGFNQSCGKYIKWFDSDDIMLQNHLEVAYKAITENNLDFVITESINFDHESNILRNKPYDFDRDFFSINAENVALNKIGWITDDFFADRQKLEEIKFNEKITTDGDEYNFFVRFLHLTTKGAFVKNLITLRRVHNDSLTKENDDTNNVNYLLKIANIKFQTATDLVLYNDVKLIKWFLAGYMRISFDLAVSKKEAPFKRKAFKMICKYNSYSKGIAFLIAFYLGYYFKKGYNIMKFARN